MSKRFSRVIVLVLVLSLASGAWADLVGRWFLDEGTGTIVHDSSGNGINGNFVGAPKWVAGKLGGALQFNGTTTGVDFGRPAKAVITGPLSIACWVNANVATGEQSFLALNAAYAFKGHGANVRFTTPGVLDHGSTNATLTPGAWQHLAVTFKPSTAGGCIFYVNGVETDRLNASAYAAAAATTAGPLLMGDNQWSERLNGLLDDVRLYDHVLTPQEIQDAMRGTGAELASNPNPNDKATDVPADATLAWQAGKFAATHDVYLGTVFSDVNNASRTNPTGVLASQDRTDVQYAPANPLTVGQTYYWRIDEVNKAPDNTIFKGQVWSFTVEPYSYPLTGIKATASTSQPSMGPEKTVDGSGLTGDQHAVEPTTMWMSTGALPNWIQFEFPAVCNLDKMLVWNSNQLVEVYVGFGAKDVTVEYSVDGVTWTTLADVPPFAQATGLPTYTANTTVNFSGVSAKFVKLTINKNYSLMATQTGLAEVRFLYIPMQARAPQPADKGTGATLGTTLTWRPGREATSHKVFFGTDPNAVANGTVAAKTVTEHSYTPDPMNLGATYYWRVDEIGGAGPYAGNVWSFTVQDAAVVDDFEAYSDDDNRIFDNWIDGFDNPKANGAIVGKNTAPFAEQTIIHGGKQSMPLYYDNTAAPLSEATLTLDQNWTLSGVKSLSLWFRGVAGNKGQLYVKINKVKVAYNGAVSDIAQATWQPWNIDLSTIGTSVNKVTSLAIGVEGSGAKGTLYIDDIRLYPKVPEVILPVQPDQKNLVARWTFDGNLKDSVGTHNGTAFGDAKVTADTAKGQVLSLDGNGDFVDVPYSADLNPAAFTVSVWANPTTGGSGYRSPLASRDDPPQKGYILYVQPNNTWEFWTGAGTTAGWNVVAGPAVTLDEWAHVSATFVDGQKVLYLNGRQVAQSTAAVTVVPNGQRPLRIGASATESAAGDFFFRGLIDDVRLYNRALSAAEVAGLSGRTEPLAKPF